MQTSFCNHYFDRIVNLNGALWLNLYPLRKSVVESKEFKEILFWVSYALWRSKAFHPYLIGSVIPFIRIGDFKQVITEKLEVVKISPEEFTRTIEKLQFIEIQEIQLKKNLTLVQELKQAYVFRFFNP